MKLKPLPLVMMAVLATPVVAQAAEESPHTFTANVTLASDYIFRGISQTGHDPAIQGGFDYAHKSGFYIGTWASNVGWIEDYQGYGSGNIEMDLYGGFRGPIGKSDFTFDVGAIQYWYPGDKTSTMCDGFSCWKNNPTDADTTELYAALGWKWFTVKYSYGLSEEIFGFADADGSYYLDISASVPIGDTGLTAGAHWGMFSFENNGKQDYDDWKVSLAYDAGKMTDKLSGVTLGMMYTDTNADGKYWTDANKEDLGEGRFTVWASKVF